jgi:aminopeptidase N
MPVVIGVTTPSGKQSYKVWIRKQEEQFEFKCPEKPLLVRFDEDNHLLKEMTFLKSVEELEFQLQKDDVIGRMWAASQLSQHLAESGVPDVLKQSATEDSSWAVRRASLQALVPSLNTAGIPFFQKRAIDAKSAVRVAALRALGDLHERSLESFFQERYQDDDSYLVEAEALRSIGKCNDPSALPFLQEASLRASPENVIHTAAQEAIKTLAAQ